jgi:hypothetical protein
MATRTSSSSGSGSKGKGQLTGNQGIKIALSAEDKATKPLGVFSDKLKEASKNTTELSGSLKLATAGIASAAVAAKTLTLATTAATLEISRLGVSAVKSSASAVAGLRSVGDAIRGIKDALTLERDFLGGDSLLGMVLNKAEEAFSGSVSLTEQLKTVIPIAGRIGAGAAKEFGIQYESAFDRAAPEISKAVEKFFDDSFADIEKKFGDWAIETNIVGTAGRIAKRLDQEIAKSILDQALAPLGEGVVQDVLKNAISSPALSRQLPEALQKIVSGSFVGAADKLYVDIANGLSSRNTFADLGLEESIAVAANAGIEKISFNSITDGLNKAISGAIVDSAIGDGPFAELQKNILRSPLGKLLPKTASLLIEGSFSGALRTFFTDTIVNTTRSAFEESYRISEQQGRRLGKLTEDFAVRSAADAAQRIQKNLSQTKVGQFLKIEDPLSTLDARKEKVEQLEAVYERLERSVVRRAADGERQDQKRLKSDNSRLVRLRKEISLIQKGVSLTERFKEREGNLQRAKSILGEEGTNAITKGVGVVTAAPLKRLGVSDTAANSIGFAVEKILGPSALKSVGKFVKSIQNELAEAGARGLSAAVSNFFPPYLRALVRITLQETGLARKAVDAIVKGFNKNTFKTALASLESSIGTTAKLIDRLFIRISIAALTVSKTFSAASRNVKELGSAIQLLSYDLAGSAIDIQVALLSGLASAESGAQKFFANASSGLSSLSKKLFSLADYLQPKMVFGLGTAIVAVVGKTVRGLDVISKKLFSLADYLRPRVASAFGLAFVDAINKAGLAVQSLAVDTTFAGEKLFSLSKNFSVFVAGSINKAGLAAQSLSLDLSFAGDSIERISVISKGFVNILFAGINRSLAGVRGLSSALEPLTNLMSDGFATISKASASVSSQIGSRRDAGIRGTVSNAFENTQSTLAPLFAAAQSGIDKVDSRIKETIALLQSLGAKAIEFIFSRFQKAATGDGFFGKLFRKQILPAIESIGEGLNKTFGGIFSQAGTESGVAFASGFSQPFVESLSNKILPVVDTINNSLISSVNYVASIGPKLQGPIDAMASVPGVLSGVGEPLEVFELLQNAVGGVSNGIFEITEKMAFFSQGLGALQQIVATGPFSLLVGQTIEFREQLLATETSLVGTSKVIKDGLRIEDPTKAIVALDAPLKSLINRMRVESQELVGITSGELVPVFQTIAGSITKVAGDSTNALEDAKNLTLDFAASLGTLGVPLDQARQEILSIFNEDITTDSQLALSLNINNATVAKWKEQGVFVDELRKKLEAFRAGNALAAKSFSGLTSNIQEVFEEISRSAGDPLLEPLLQQLQSVYDWLQENQRQLTGAFQPIVQDLKRIIESIGSVAGTAFQNFGEITGKAVLYLSQSLANFVKSFEEGFKTVTAILGPVIKGFTQIAEAVRPVAGPILKLFLTLKLLSAGIGLLVKGFGLLANLLPGVGEALFFVNLQGNGVLQQFINLKNFLGSTGGAGFLTLGKYLDKIPGAMDAVSKSFGPLGGIFAGFIPQIATLGIKVLALSALLQNAGIPIKEIANNLLRLAPAAITGFKGIVTAAGVTNPALGAVLTALSPLNGEIGKAEKKFADFANSSDKAEKLNKKFSGTLKGVGVQLAKSALAFGGIALAVTAVVAVLGEMIDKSKDAGESIRESSQKSLESADRLSAAWDTAATARQRAFREERSKSGGGKVKGDGFFDGIQDFRRSLPSWVPLADTGVGKTAFKRRQRSDEAEREANTPLGAIGRAMQGFNDFFDLKKSEKKTLDIDRALATGRGVSASVLQSGALSALEEVEQGGGKKSIENLRKELERLEASGNISEERLSSLKSLLDSEFPNGLAQSEESTKVLRESIEDLGKSDLENLEKTFRELQERNNSFAGAANEKLTPIKTQLEELKGKTGPEAAEAFKQIQESIGSLDPSVIPVDQIKTLDNLLQTELPDGVAKSENSIKILTGALDTVGSVATNALSDQFLSQIDLQLIDLEGRLEYLQKVGQGDSEAALEIRGRINRVKEIQGSFNTMREQIKTIQDPVAALADQFTQASKKIEKSATDTSNAIGIASGKTKIEQAKGEISDSSAEIEILKAETQEIVKEVTVRNELLAKLRKQYDELDAKGEKARAEDTKRQIDTLNSEALAKEAELLEKKAELRRKSDAKVLSDLEKSQTEALDVVKIAEAERNAEITKLKNEGAISAAEADAARADGAIEAAQTELANEQALLKQLKALPKPNDPDDAREREEKIRASKLKTSELIIQLLDAESAAYEAQTQQILDQIERRTNQSLIALEDAKQSGAVTDAEASLQEARLSRASIKAQLEREKDPSKIVELQLQLEKNQTQVLEAQRQVREEILQIANNQASIQESILDRTGKITNAEKGILESQRNIQTIRKKLSQAGLDDLERSELRVQLEQARSAELQAQKALKEEALQLAENEAQITEEGLIRSGKLESEEQAVLQTGRQVQALQEKLKDSSLDRAERAQLQLELEKALTAEQEAQVSLIESKLQSSLQQIDNAYTGQKNLLNEQNGLIERANRAFEMRNNLLEAGDKLRQAQTNAILSEFDVLSSMEKSDFRRKQIAEITANIKLQAAIEEVAASERTLDLQQQQQRLQLEQQKIQAQISLSEQEGALARLRAEREIAALKKTTSPEELEAIDLQIEAAQKGLQGQRESINLLNEQQSVQEKIFQMQRDTLAAENSSRILQARAEAIGSIQDPGQRFRAQRSLRQEIAEGRGATNYRELLNTNQSVARQEIGNQAGLNLRNPSSDYFRTGTINENAIVRTPTTAQTEVPLSQSIDRLTQSIDENVSGVVALNQAIDARGSNAREASSGLMRGIESGEATRLSLTPEQERLRRLQVREPNVPTVGGSGGGSGNGLVANITVTNDFALNGAPNEMSARQFGGSVERQMTDVLDRVLKRSAALSSGA